MLLLNLSRLRITAKITGPQLAGDGAGIRLYTEPRKVVAHAGDVTLQKRINLGVVAWIDSLSEVDDYDLAFLVEHVERRQIAVDPVACQ